MGCLVSAREVFELLIPRVMFSGVRPNSIVLIEGFLEINIVMNALSRATQLPICIIDINHVFIAYQPSRWTKLPDALNTSCIPLTPPQHGHIFLPHPLLALGSSCWAHIGIRPFEIVLMPR